MNLLKNFRENLAAACELAGLSQSELARRSGIHVTTVNRILRGHLDPSVKVCEQLATAAGIRPDTIFLEPERVAG